MIKRTNVCPECGGIDHKKDCPHRQLTEIVTWTENPFAILDFLQQKTGRLSNEQVLKRLQLFPDIGQFRSTEFMPEEFGGDPLYFVSLMREARVSSVQLVGLNKEDRRAKVLEQIKKKLLSK